MGVYATIEFKFKAERSSPNIYTWMNAKTETTPQRCDWMCFCPHSCAGINYLRWPATTLQGQGTGAFSMPKRPIQEAEYTNATPGAISSYLLEIQFDQVTAESGKYSRYTDSISL